MKKELDSSKAAFKLDLIETVNADPMVSPSDLKVLAAYLAVMSWPQGRAWLASSLAMAMTGLSHGQFWKSRSRLLGNNDEKRAYLIPVRKGGKVSTYQLINPWRDEALDMVAARLAHNREVQRQKKVALRAKSSVHRMEGLEADLSLQKVDGQEGGCPSRICSSVPPDFAPYSPLGITPREEGAVEKTDGSNVVPFNKRRAS
ncbi:hypothetical protein LB517_10755 [Mesorhizobium sp. BR1-1-12]|uniref:hypothetical protein n=1 Tax=unclassified Mesorhizobium TaxID=325217 RepID=UPI001CCA302B|nr:MULTISPECIES: hypothetical protein [unclassified Mesorhizobium]MBZ9919108.1 hypothetical protein [Mesorhizobium sp. BR1-1-7]MBZ9970113.1 hypothetical protein [Mesorhizobium sp. BR1-1-12]